MKKVTLTSASIMSALSLGSSPAIAADHSWDGVYGGLSVGYQDAVLKNNDYLVNYYALTGTPHPQSAIGGAFAGYNYQLPQSPVVLGVEASYDLGDQSASTTKNGSNVANDARVSAATALNGRLGYSIGGDSFPISRLALCLPAPTTT